ncbi:MAG: Gfo/Idh/MocA family oxidoreductase [Caldilineaceae bacterium]|jgi:predicted dehydrogenase
MSNVKKQYAIVGTGGRAAMYVEAIVDTYADFAELVALCDLSQVRMDYYVRQIEESGHGPVPTYKAADFDRMLAETNPDVVIVTSMDSTHHEYIIRAMEAGCDVICEKPMTIDAGKAQAILDAIGRTGRTLRITFNYRYAALSTKVRELLMQGLIGNTFHVNFQWLLDTYHGADYFRRWHREKDKSGGLLVHKATHHFDLVNWWIGSRPETVFALGALRFYGADNAAERGQTYTYQRYTGVPEAASDPFALMLDKNETLTELYLNAEEETGYIRDRNVFGAPVTIEDTMSVTARYKNGVILTYALLAYCPWEGYRVSFTGDMGRLEVELVEQVGKTFVGGQEETVDADAETLSRFGGAHIRVYPTFGTPYEVPVPIVSGGGHGGGDPVMLDQLFLPEPPEDPFRRAASHVDGAASILLGIAANRSMAEGRAVNIDELIDLDALADAGA